MVHADIAEVAGIEDQALSAWSAKLLAAEMQVASACQFVAELTPSIVGWCCCRLIAPEAELLKIAVDKKYRRQGVGSSLLCRLITELRRQKIKALFLELRAADKEAAGFYAQQGFLQVGLRPAYYADPPDSARILCKSIR